MIHLTLPEGYDRMQAPFYLAMEEWAANTLPDGEEGFFLWQLEPTVVFGRNQRVEKEVDLEYCRSHGIRFFRRKSGGGCIYADRNNVMFSYVASNRGDDVQTLFSRYTSKVAAFLRTLGLDASANTRNDVLIGDRKVSGWAFLRLADRSLIHGTMLYDVDTAAMSRAITPSKSKLESKGVKSVESRITTIHSQLPALSLEEFKQAAINTLTDSEMRLTSAQAAEVEAMSAPYYEPRWIYGPRQKGNIKRTLRLDGIGEFEADILLDEESNRIVDLDLRGDFFPAADLDPLLINPLRGVEFTSQAVAQALNPTDVAAAVSGLTSEHIINLLFK